MKQKTFVIQDDKVIEQLVMFLKTWPAGSEPWECVVRLHKKKREVIQNSLYWRWIGFAANELGMTKEDLHLDLKRRLLVPIYERDDPDFCEMLLSLRKLYAKGYRDDSKFIFKQMIGILSTTKATVKQFAEYLREFERDMAGKGIALPHKEDEYYDSFDIKRG